MRVRRSLVVLCACLGACGTLPATVNTPYLPPNTFGIFEDNDIGAINQSSWALASAVRTRNDPVDAAKAVIAVEYLAGELSSSPRWSPYSDTPKYKMLEAQQDLRKVLGVRPDAPPQLVVNELLGMIGALLAGNQPAALQALSGPAFTLPPPVTFATLANLPYVKSANLATMQATEVEYPGGGAGR